MCRSLPVSVSLIRRACLQRTLTILLGLVTLASCRTFNSPSDPKLIGGTLATATDIPYVVFIRSNVGDGCTATKIAAKMYLTAAHCLQDSDTRGIRAGFTNLADVTFTIDSARHVQFGDDIADDARFTIKNVFVHPQYVASCLVSSGDNCGDTLGRYPWPPDVGIFEIKEETPSIPIAAINFAPIPDGTKVIVAGYGCEEGLYLPFNYALRLKFGQTVTVPPSALDAAESLDNFDDPIKLAKTVWITKGLTDQGVSLCPGDSGGPMFRADVDPVELAGINSNYSFLKGDDIGVAKTNWHTRLDNESRYGIDQWITKVLNHQESPTKVSANRLILNDSPGVAYLTQSSPKSELSMKVGLQQLVEIVTRPADTVSVQIVSREDGVVPLTPVNGNTYKLADGEYRIISTLSGSTDQPVLISARNNPPLDFGSTRTDLSFGGPPIRISLASDNTLATFRLEIPSDGQYQINIDPPQKMRVLFFHPDERSVPFYSEMTEDDGFFKADFSAGSLLDLVLSPFDDGSGDWPKDFTVKLTGPM